MTEKVINVGVDPGNQGDGDTIRVAFMKAQSNFDELYSLYPITDTSLDHSDPNVKGTIAEALAIAEAAGGGTVLIGQGVFLLSSTTLVVGANCRLVGSGKNSTELKSTHQYNVINVSNGALGTPAYWAVKDLSITLSEINSSSAIATTPSEGSNGIINNVLVTGGAADSWGLTMDAVNVISVTDYVYYGQGSGMRWINSANYPVNYGDSLIQNVEIALQNAFTTGVLIASPVSIFGGTNNNRINNILFSRIEVRTLDGIVRDGTIGIHLRNVARITLQHIDIEHLNKAVLQESKINGGAIATGNSFYQIHAIGCSIDYEEVGLSPTNQVVLGGTGRFSGMQQLPSSNITADHPILGKNRVLTAVRPIVAISDSASPYLLSVEDSGSIFTNKGASAAVTFQLPPANLSYSVEYEFHLSSAGSAIRVQPAPGDIIRPGQKATGQLYESDVVFGQVLKIRNIDGTTWSTLIEQGNWTSA